MKKAKLLNVYKDFLTKKFKSKQSTMLVRLQKKSTTLCLKVITNFSKVDENLGKNSGKCE